MKMRNENNFTSPSRETQLPALVPEVVESGLPSTKHPVAIIKSREQRSKRGSAKRPRFRPSTAYHEAGHAVTAVAQGIRVSSVSLHPDPNRGTLEWYSFGRTTFEDGQNMYGDEGVIILLAGATAQKKHAPCSMRRFNAAGDHEKANSLVFGGVKQDDSVYALAQQRWDWYRRQTSKLIEANWHVIDAVAKRLLDVGEIGGAEVKKIFCQLKGVRRKPQIDPERFVRRPASGQG